MAESAVLSPGKIRRLAASSTAEGIFCVLAVDHRDSLRVFLAPDDPGSISAAALTTLKLDLARGLGTAASAVMLEPEFSAAQAIVDGALPGSVGFLAAVEAQGYLGDPTARQTLLLEDWGVEKAARLGATGIKLLVLYRPDGGAVSEAQEQTISQVVAECARHDVPLFLEPLLYGRDGVQDDRRALVVETARRLGALGPDVLKMQFPLDTDAGRDLDAWADACRELDEVAAAPWALLSGGGTFERFRDQLAVACAAGASGFMVGRALWGEYAMAPADERPELLDRLVRPRFEELCRIARSSGRDWRSRYSMPAVDERWYVGY